MQVSLHYATVIDNEDSDQKAKVQVRVLPEMKDMDEDKLPWVRPFINPGMSENSYGYNVPEVDSKIWVVFIDKYFHDGYYLTGSFIDGFFDFSSVQSDLNDVTELSDKSYANIRFTRLPDGTVIFHNDDTGEVGIKHSSGKYVVIDDSGDIHISGDATIQGDQTVEGDSTIEGDSTVQGDLAVGSATQPLTLYTSLETALSTLLTILAAHIHVDPLTGTTGPPQPPLTTTTTATIGLSNAQSQDSKSS